MFEATQPYHKCAQKQVMCPRGVAKSWAKVGMKAFPSSTRIQVKLTASDNSMYKHSEDGARAARLRHVDLLFTRIGIMSLMWKLLALAVSKWQVNR